MGYSKLSFAPSVYTVLTGFLVPKQHTTTIMTGENFQSVYDNFRAPKQQSYAVDPDLSKPSLTSIPVEEEKTGVSNWVYSDPPM